MEEAQPQHADGRVRYRLDAQSRAVLDSEIAKLTTNGPMVALTRPQMLHVLVAQAACCKCDAEKRELPGIVVSPTDGNRRWAIEADSFVRAVVQTERQKLADDGQYASLNAHQVLRMLLMRAARCRCQIASTST